MANLVAIYRVNAVKDSSGVANGNYSGYDATGTRENRVHIPKALAESFSLDNKTAMPVYAIVSVETFDAQDENKKPILDSEGKQKTFTQNRAGSLFVDKQKAIEAINSGTLLTLEAKSALHNVAKTLELTPEVMKALETAPF